MITIKLPDNCYPHISSPPRFRIQVGGLSVTDGQTDIQTKNILLYIGCKGFFLEGIGFGRGLELAHKASVAMVLPCFASMVGG